VVEAIIFEEIPANLREDIDYELRLVAMDILHAEAVEAGDLPAAPHPLFDGPLGKILLLIFQLLAGGVIGFGAVALTLWLMRSLAVVMS